MIAMSGANSSSPEMPAIAENADLKCQSSRAEINAAMPFAISGCLSTNRMRKGLFALHVDRRGHSAKTAESYRSLEGVFLPILAAMKFRITPPDYNPNGARCATKRSSLHYLRHIKTMFRQSVVSM